MTDEIYLKNSLTVNNSIITLGDTDDSGKGRHFKSRFIQPGLAGYPGQYGNALIKKENLDKFVYTLRNKPVIINHKDEIEEKDKVGEVFNVWFNPDDGWYWCDGIITDVTAQNLIQDKGWSVSCSYNFTSYNDDGGTENNVPYDIEFLDGEFMHLAIVDKPRYEGANIVMNAKDKDGNEGEWITVKGNHVFVKKGQSKEEAVKEWIEKWEDKDKDELVTVEKADEETIKKNKETNDRWQKAIKETAKKEGWDKEGKKETNSQKDFKNHLDRIEKLIKKYNLEPNEEDELLDELGSFEMKLDEGLEPREEEELREELYDFEDDIKRHYEMNKKVKNSTTVKEITMSVLNELESFVKGVIKNANDEDEKEIKNEKVDKRELIEEVGGMLKGKVDDEIIKTIIKKMEEASYDESEAGSADNKKVKNESEEEKEDKKAENKKVKNEESEDDKEKAEELKKDEKEDVDNKCNNSKTDFFDKMNKIYNSTLTPDKSETEYTSRADRLKAGEEYFKV